MAMFADGRPISEEHQQGVGLDGSMADIPFFVGSKDGGETPFILNALRVSAVAKEPVALTDAQPSEEIYTLLLDRFDVPKKIEGGVTRPEVIHATGGPASGGKILGHARLVEHPQPGLALYKEKAAGASK